MSGGNTKSNALTRKDFLRYMALIAGATITATEFTACESKKDRYGHIKGSMQGASAKLGHQLRDSTFPEPTIIDHVEAVIIGGGVAGLSAARIFQQHGFTNFQLLELEQHVGGNSSYGQNDYSAYPLGAHYLPIPNPNNKALLELLAEAGIITGYDASGIPIYNETDLCYDPEERLFINNRWQEGLVPNFGVSKPELADITRFLAAMDTFRWAKGTDQRYAFDIPLLESSSDEQFTRLDKITMAQYLADEKYTSKALRWYVDYCCRDDYGAGINEVSAWAGIHYFASRKGKAANAESSHVLTWPEGNGYLVKHLKQYSAQQANTQCLAYKITPHEHEVWVDYYDVNTHTNKRIVAKAAIMAMPQFIAKRLLPAAQYDHAFVYSPWLVANVTLSEVPMGSGYPLCWDNVAFEGKSLGYVNAQQQTVRVTMPEKQVITYYLPLDQLSPVASRKYAINLPHAQWVKLIVDDLETMHPNIHANIENIDTWVWGHGMVRPHPGFISGEAVKAARQPVHERIFFAHSDLSGISIFEEAFYHGNNAARALLAKLGK
ncbi:putative NAD(P)-binding protein [Chitinophaga skermanii]|uniref:Putative NAD(P)-binding protein n=1 Tax=Chitinophaga skermanii TaxID=331697 RepID=A0A327QS65_9BACT|nr:NAD(P)-binding protein [Chitinophaga skermanii]RAJ06798.1 putative NAD(P)-binding protein [Chitinophaga skermanii]